MKNVRKLAKELLAECYEKGYPAIVGISDKDTGESIGTGNGQVGDILLVMATLFIRLEKQSGNDATEMAKSVAKTVKQLKKEGY